MWAGHQSLLLCKERFQEAECQDGRVFSPSAVSLSLHLPRLLFILLKQAGLSRLGEAALRSVWIARSREKEFVNSLRSPPLFFTSTKKQLDYRVSDV